MTVIVQVNGLPHEQYRQATSQPVMSKEEHQRRIVRSVQRWNYHPMRNHSRGRTKPGRVIFHAESGQA